MLRYGIFGVGRIGRVHGRILRAQGCEIVAVGDENADAISSAVDELGLEGVTTCSSSEEMAQLDIDAVVVASHTEHHARDARPLVAAGVPVYLEKPLASELDEARALVAEVGDRRDIMQVGLQRRFDEALGYAKQLLDAGVVGELREIRCVLRDQHPPPATYRSRGLIIDMGIHVADEAIWLTGELPCEVWARTFEARAYQSPIQEGGNTAHVGFSTPSGIIGRLDLSRTHSSGPNNATYVIGTRGTLHVGRFAGYPGPIPVEVWTEHGTLHQASRIFDMTPPDSAEFLPRFRRAYERAHEAFRDALKQGEPFAVTQMEALAAQIFVEAADRSARNQGEPVELERSSRELL